MAAHGTILEFSSAQETWTSYVERLQQYLAARRYWQRALLLSVCGPTTYRLIRNLVSPKKLMELKFHDLVDLVTKASWYQAICDCPEVSFQHKKLPWWRVNLNICSRALPITEHCNFGTLLNEMLHDQIVYGIEDQKIKCRLLAEPELTFDKAYELANCYSIWICRQKCQGFATCC